MSRFLILIIVSLLAGCNQSATIDKEEKKVTSQRLRRFEFLISSAQTKSGYFLEVDSVEYMVVPDINDSNRYLFISTSDTDFTTHNLSVGNHYKDINEGELEMDPGWAVYVPLANGWNAAFGVDSSATYISSDSTIQWFFKRNASKSEIGI